MKIYTSSSRAQSRDLLNRFLHFGRNDVVFLTLFFIFVPLARAQSATLSISPPVVEIMLAPNKQATQTFFLKTEGQNVKVIPELHLAKPSDTSGHITIDPNPYNPTSSPLSVEIAGPPTSPTLTFEAASTDISEDVYLALVFLPKDSPLTNDRITTLSPVISALILVTINPTGVMPIDLDITNFETPIFHDSWMPFTTTPVISNKTPIMIRPTGSYDIVSPSGKTIFSIPLYPNLILGDSSRRILGSHTRCEGIPQTECVDADPIPLTWTPTWRNFGPHSLRLTINTQGGTKLTQIEKTIWIIPLRLILVIITIIILTIMFLTVRRKHSTVKVV